MNNNKAKFAQAIHDCLGLDWKVEENRPVLANRAAEISRLWTAGGVQRDFTAVWSNSWRAKFARWILGL